MATVQEKTTIIKQDRQKSPSGLKKCFQALVDRKQVNLDMCVLKLMLKFELQVDLDNLDTNLATVLPYMLIIYIRNWPGWQKSKEYYSGRLNYREWFNKFRQYIIVRLNYLIKNGYAEVQKEIKNDKMQLDKLRVGAKEFSEKGTQTDVAAAKGIAPFNISIECPAKLLRSLVFCAKDNDILLSHHLEPTWNTITVEELVNWPHVAIDFISSELYFKRYNRSEHIRFINLTNVPLDSEKNEFIEEVNILNPNEHRMCYTLNRLIRYSQQYLKVLAKTDLPKSKLEIIEAVLKEFLKDVAEININCSMATNTSVLFNIGKCTFSCNKKISKTKFLKSNTEVGYCETFIPKMETHLIHFRGMQDFTTQDVTFTSLNEIDALLDSKKDAGGSLIPVLIFKCLFCDVSFVNHEELNRHFEIVHGMEPNIVCTKCLKFLSISTLSKLRWHHVCNAR